MRISMLMAFTSGASSSSSSAPSFGAKTGTTKFASNSVHKITPDARKISVSRCGNGSPDCSVYGMVMMMESVTAPFGPDSVVTSASRTSCLPVRRFALLSQRSITYTQMKRTPTTSAVTNTTRPHKSSELISSLRHDGMMAFGSCMPSITNTTPLITNTSVSHTLLDAIFRRAATGVGFCGSSVISRPAATTARMPLVPKCSAHKNVMNGVNTSNTTCTVTLS